MAAVVVLRTSHRYYLPSGCNGEVCFSQKVRGEGAKGKRLFHRVTETPFEFSFEFSLPETKRKTAELEMNCQQR
jgi:hypothetical protein